MAPSSSSSPSSSKSHHHHKSSNFTPIQECERESELEDPTPSPKHHPTPLPQLRNKNGKSSKKRSDTESVSSYDDSVSCYKCRPHARESKISVVPLDNNKHSFSTASPNGIFKSIMSSLTRKSPKSMNDGTSVAALTPREEQWKIAVAELSNKLIQTTRKRDEALLEASRLKYSMAELEKKLNKLEIYCHNLKSGLEECSGNSPYQMGKKINQIEKERRHIVGVTDLEKVIEHFLVSISEARSSIRHLSRSLTMQIRHLGTKVYERISLLLQPYDIKIPISKNPLSLLFYLEALINQAFFEDFESVGFQKTGPTQILNPIDRCEANFGSYNVLHGLTWEEVLSKGTRHFSEDFSKFCDRKMSEIVAMLGWNRAWPEPLLQAFFGASKSVWLVHLLANSVHPALPVFRVDKGVGFDPVYMEDMGVDKAKKLVPSVVRIMVAPGFYVYGNVVKCKVLCRYYNTNNNGRINGGINGLNLSP